MTDNKQYNTERIYVGSIDVTANRKREKYRSEIIDNDNYNTVSNFYKSDYDSGIYKSKNNQGYDQKNRYDTSSGDLEKK